MMFWRSLIGGVIRKLGFSALASFGGYDLYPVLAVGGEYPVKTRQFNTGFGNQGGQLGHEIQRLEEEMNQMCRQCAVNDAQHLAHDRWAAGQQKTQRNRYAQHPLAGRLMR